MKALFQNILAILLASAAIAAHGSEINVFAAASLTDALKKIASAYNRDKIVFDFGASSTLARQIEEGAPADIFFSADEAKMDDLEKKGLIFNQTRKSRLSNSLVIVIAAEEGARIAGPSDLATALIKRLALAEPKTVPAGIYAKKYLEKQHLWSAVEPKVIPTENVRGALAAVASGNVEAAIVYRTDAAISKKVKVAYEVPAADGPPISYPMAVIKETKHAEAAKCFLQYLNSDEAAKIFETFGFIVRG